MDNFDVADEGKKTTVPKNVGEVIGSQQKQRRIQNAALN